MVNPSNKWEVEKEKAINTKKKRKKRIVWSYLIKKITDFMGKKQKKTSFSVLSQQMFLFVFLIAALEQG